MLYHPIHEVAEHLLRRHLIVRHRVHLLYRHRLVDDVNPFHRAVIVIHTDFFAKHLLTFIPEDGLTIQIRAGILLMRHQRVAHTLKVPPVHPHLMISEQIPIHRVRLLVIGHHPQRVAMHIQRVLLRKLIAYRTVGRQRDARLILIAAVVACQHAFVLHVDQHHIAECLTHTRRIVECQAVTHDVTHILIHMRPVHQIRLSRLRVVVTTQGIHERAVRRDDVRLRHNPGNLRVGIVVQFVRLQVKLRILQHHIVLEDGLVQGRCVLSVVRVQHIIAVIQCSMTWIEAHTLQAVIINDVRHQLGLPMGQHRPTLCMSLHHRAVIQQRVARQGQRVALHHLHVAIGIERVVVLIEPCAVTIQIHAIVVQLHVSHQHIGTRIHIVLVQHIAMNQLHLLARLLPRFVVGTRSRKHTKH